MIDIIWGILTTLPSDAYVPPRLYVLWYAGDIRDGATNRDQTTQKNQSR
jgi:hypothetical protein